MAAYELGPFLLTFNDLIGINPGIEVSVLFEPANIVWKTLSGEPFIRAAYAEISQPPILNGNYQVEEEIHPLSYTEALTITPTSVSKSDEQLSFQGKLNRLGVDNDYDYYFSFSLVLDQNNNADYYSVSSTKYALKFDMNVTSDDKNPINRVFLTYWCEDNENFFGFGESFTHFNLKGRNVPILVSEQGVGRDLEPITSYLNANVSDGVGGHW
jgi:hypothetical protein